MSRIGYFLLLVLTFGAVIAPTRAQTVQPMSSSLAPEKMMAKEKAVEEHAKKHAECKKQSKEAGLGFIARKKFVSDCMAAK